MTNSQKLRETMGLMFHHFHSVGHPESQGSISAETFRQILTHVGLENILSAHTWMERYKTGKLTQNDLCITFDDTLLCQLEIAQPILDEFGLTAFWFVNSSVLDGVPEKLEIYRYFRTTCFENIDNFYSDFFKKVKFKFPKLMNQLEQEFNPTSYLVNCLFYSENDRIFRYLRDQILNCNAFHEIMHQMFEDCSFDFNDVVHRLWLNRDQVRTLHTTGHIIGLHSHTHPTNIASLPISKQYAEYKHNSDYLTSLLGVRPTVMAHPCNSYSVETLRFLHSLDVSIGFRADTEKIENRSMLELPREDHSNILRQLSANSI